MNETNASMTSDASSQNNDVPYWLIIISGLIVSFCIVSLSVMMTAPRIGSNIRYMCCNIIFYDIGVIIFYMLHYTLLDYPKWFYHRATQYSVLGQWFAVTGFSVERLIAIHSPYFYQEYCKGRHVKAFMVVELFFYTTIIVLTSMIDRESKRAVRVCWGAVALHTTFSVICLACCLKTLAISRVKFRSSHIIPQGIATDIKNTCISGKETLSVVCILFVVLHVPIGIETITLKCVFDPMERLYTSYIILINSTLDPLLYVWRFKECRLQGLKCFSRIPGFGFLKQTVETRRIEIFNIPISDQRRPDLRQDSLQENATRRHGFVEPTNDTTTF